MRLVRWSAFSGALLLMAPLFFLASLAEARSIVNEDKLGAFSGLPEQPSSIAVLAVEPPRGDPDIVVVDDFNFPINPTITGSSVNWLTGATCNCDDNPGYDFNPYQVPDGLRFWWWGTAAAGRAGLSLDGQTYAVLGPGDTIGPGATFITSSLTEATQHWRQESNVDGFLGFRFTNADTGQLNYGYARMTTTGTIGFPMTIVSYAFNSAGGGMSKFTERVLLYLPEPPGDDLFADRFEE